MKAYPVLMLLVLASTMILGMQLSASPATAPEINAKVDIAPETFNLKRANAANGVITAYISDLKKGEASYDVNDINMSTIKLYYGDQLITEAIRATVKKDVLTAKFDAAQVANFIWTNILYHMGTIPPQEDYWLPLTVSGQLINDEDSFAGNDAIKVILP